MVCCLFNDSFFFFFFFSITHTFRKKERKRAGCKFLPLFPPSKHVISVSKRKEREAIEKKKRRGGSRRKIRRRERKEENTPSLAFFPHGQKRKEKRLSLSFVPAAARHPRFLSRALSLLCSTLSLSSLPARERKNGSRSSSSSSCAFAVLQRHRLCRQSKDARVPLDRHRRAARRQAQGHPGGARRRGPQALRLRRVDGRAGKEEKKEGAASTIGDDGQQATLSRSHVAKGKAASLFPFPPVCSRWTSFLLLYLRSWRWPDCAEALTCLVCQVMQ